MTPEGLRDNLLLPIVLFTAFTECGLVKGHGFPGAGEDTITGHITESFLGVGSQIKKHLRTKRDGKPGHGESANDGSPSAEGGSEPEARENL